MRVFLTIVLPLLAPSLLYILWLVARARRTGTQPAPSQADGQPPPPMLGDTVPWVTLTLSGALLATGVVVAMYLTQATGNPDDIYIPPRFENGRILPGESIPRADAETNAAAPNTTDPDKAETTGTTAR